MVELLVTCVLIGLIIPAAMKGISIAAMVASNASHRALAISLAETKLSEIILEEEWQNSSLSGDFEEEYPEYSWSMSSFDRTETDIKQVEVSILWNSRGHDRNITLTTLVYTGDE